MCNHCKKHNAMKKRRKHPHVHVHIVKKKSPPKHKRPKRMVKRRRK